VPYFFPSTANKEALNLDRISRGEQDSIYLVFQMTKLAKKAVFTALLETE
jgi:hypothetical protein